METSKDASLTIGEVSKKYGIKATKLRALRAEGAFPGAFQAGDGKNAHWHLPVRAVEAWLRERQRKAHVAPRPARTRCGR